MSTLAADDPRTQITSLETTDHDLPYLAWIALCAKLFPRAYIEPSRAPPRPDLRNRPGEPGRVAVYVRRRAAHVKLYHPRDYSYLAPILERLAKHNEKNGSRIVGDVAAPVRQYQRGRVWQALYRAWHAKVSARKEAKDA